MRDDFLSCGKYFRGASLSTSYSSSPLKNINIEDEPPKMTEECHKDGNSLVRVQAQVMTRDDSTGGWVPMGGGGLSNVALCKIDKISSSGDASHKYIIQGQRIADSMVVLDCTIKKDFQYTKANPKFHHWKTDDKRFGLTFERSDDAKAFDKGISIAVADMKEGSGGGSGSPEDSVFQEMDLPLRKDSSSHSASTTSTTTSSPAPCSPSGLAMGVPESFSFPTHTHSHGNHHLHRIHYVTSPPRALKHSGSPPSEKSSTHKSDSFDSSSGHEDIWVRSDEPTSLSGKSEQGLLETEIALYKEDSYVFFNKSKGVNEYSYPNLEPVQKPPTKREISTRRQQPFTNHPPLPIKESRGKLKKGRGSCLQTDQSGRLLNQRAKCKHCNEMFNQEENVRGSCEEAPDGVTKCIEHVSCVSCAQCIIYHCMSDADGEYRHPCVCDHTDSSNCKKWTAMAIFSIFVPCLWCYWPLTKCHDCGVRCGCCGGRHKAV